MQVKIQGFEVKNLVTDIKTKLVRTYKGEIERTQAGIVAAFPISFITPGFDITFKGDREQISAIEQILLSHDLVELIVDRKELNFKGMFSCTGNDKTELRDKGERSIELTVSVVSDGTNITHSTGRAFTVKAGETTIADNCYFGKIYKVASTYSSYKYKGMSLPNSKILILGDTTLTAN